MDDEIDVSKETAAASQEWAKTTSKAIEASEHFSRFIAVHVGESFKTAMGIFDDKLKFIRWERQYRFMTRVEELKSELGSNVSMRPLPLKYAIPLLEAATLEDDDYLQDMWAKLLINSANEQSDVNLQRSYINILEQLTALEAKVLAAVYKNDFSLSERVDVITANLPDEAPLDLDYDTVNDPESKYGQPNDDVKMALANLTRLCCLALPTTFNGKEIFHHANPTLMGRRFVDACTLKK